MQFLYPLFLIAGISLLIPLWIHLFNLRKYKTVYFPYTRFFKNVNLQSQKPSQLKHRWLWLIRTLFLVFLILAFAQPYFSSNHQANTYKSCIIYIDNSPSMSLAKGQKNMLDHAKEDAKRIVEKEKGPFVILSNTALNSFQTLTKQQALEHIAAIEIVEHQNNVDKVFQQVSNFKEGNHKLKLYYISDFQKNQFFLNPLPKELAYVDFTGITVPQVHYSNFGIDTAYFENPSIQKDQNQSLIVKTYYHGALPAKEQPILQLKHNNEVKAIVQLQFTSSKTRIDTLNYITQSTAWEPITLKIQEDQYSYDDQFNIALQASEGLKVQLIDFDHSNPFLNAALTSSSIFKLKHWQGAVSLNSQEEGLWILNGLKGDLGSFKDTLKQALLNGTKLLVFLADNASVTALNKDFETWLPIHFEPIDTSAQKVSALQTEHPFVKAMFEHIPDNVQLPYTTLHYPIKAQNAAYPQWIMNFRNGDPFMVSYSYGKGEIYFCTSPIEPFYGNFQTSAYFLPFLYYLASQNSSNSIYAATSVQKTPLFFPISNGVDLLRNQLKISNNTEQHIPLQKPNGKGIDFYVGALPAGFYKAQIANSDSILLGVNHNRSEADLAVWSLSELKEQWKGKGISWAINSDLKRINSIRELGTFPLWKLCTILAVLMLGLETFILIKNIRTKE